jgi:hypothetical protein
LIGGLELGPPPGGVDAVTPGEVGGEIFDMNLHPGPEGGEQVQGHAPFLPDQDGKAALSPGPDFGTGGHGFARLNMGTSPELLEEAVRRIASVL